MSLPRPSVKNVNNRRASQSSLACQGLIVSLGVCVFSDGEASEDPRVMREVGSVFQSAGASKVLGEERVSVNRRPTVRDMVHR